MHLYHSRRGMESAVTYSPSLGPGFLPSFLPSLPPSLFLPSLRSSLPFFSPFFQPFLLPASLPSTNSFFFFNFYFNIGVQLINSVVSVSGIQQSDSVIHIHVSLLFQILFPFRLLQNIEQSFLCYTVGPC